MKQPKRAVNKPANNHRIVSARLPDDIRGAIEKDITDFAAREGVILTRTQVIERRLRQAYGLVGA